MSSKDQYGVFRDFILSKYPKAVLDWWLSNQELQFYPEPSAVNRDELYTCFKDETGNMIIETDF